ncbi:MAG: adenine nucleotide alpha hydrolase family protein [Planctomycetota bacterium]
MERHLLITVSEQQSALCGIRFVGYFLSNMEELRLTLYYTAPRPAKVWADERTHDKEEWAKKQAEQFEAKGREALDSSKKMLCKWGFNPDLIETKLAFRHKSRVRDIVYEGETGRYDALVLGRRGLSWLEELFDESTSKSLLETKVSFPIWFCRRPKEGSRNVLVCLDGTEAAYRMTDHVAFILAPEEKHEVTLFTINKGGDFDEEALNAIRSAAMEHFKENSFPVYPRRSFERPKRGTTEPWRSGAPRPSPDSTWVP